MTVCAPGAMAVGVLALQGSFNEHIAGVYLPFSSYANISNTQVHISVFLHTHFFVYVHGVWSSYLCMYILVVLCVVLRRLGVKGLEIRKPEQLQSVTSLIIPGGESTTMAKLAEFHNLVFSLSIFLFYACIYSLCASKLGRPLSKLECLYPLPDLNC